MDTLQVTCTVVDTELVTPAGTFVCNEYHYREGQIRAAKSNYDMDFNTNIQSYSNRGLNKREVYDVYLYFASGMGYVGYIKKSSGLVQFKRILTSVSLH